MGSLALQACSQSDGQATGSNADRDQVIALAVANGNGIATRAGRPLLSSEANHTIENVVVYVVKASDNTVVATKTFSDWQNESADYRTDDGRYAEFLLDDRLDDGDYRLFAVGYHNDSAYGDIPGTLVPAGTFQENAVLSLAAEFGFALVIRLPGGDRRNVDLAEAHVLAVLQIQPQQFDAFAGAAEPGQVIRADRSAGGNGGATSGLLFEGVQRFEHGNRQIVGFFEVSQAMIESNLLAKRTDVGFRILPV